jgi:7-keto-8-aminopelargonate synthetase-like enzyme
LLVNTARPFIFATAPPPAVAAAAEAALRILEGEPELVDRLGANATTLRMALGEEGLPSASRTQILPVLVGEAEPTMDLCDRVLERGVFAQGIRPPTVPEGSCRLRFTVMATHEEPELRRAAAQVGAAARELGLVERSALAA